MEPKSGFRGRRDVRRIHACGQNTGKSFRSLVSAGFGLTAENGTDCIRPPEPPNLFPTKQGAGTRNMRFLYALE